MKKNNKLSFSVVATKRKEKERKIMESLKHWGASRKKNKRLQGCS
jgi:hypothetical protein